jgi:hypothetical protein
MQSARNASMPLRPARAKLPPPLPSLPVPARSEPPPTANTTAIRIEEIRSIARDVAAREAEAKKVARLHAVAIRLDGSAADEPSQALRRMFPHLVRQSPIEVAVRVVFFLGHVAVALSGVGLRALGHIPRLAVQARDGLRAAWMRAAFRDSKKPNA